LVPELMLPKRLLVPEEAVLPAMMVLPIVRVDPLSMEIAPPLSPDTRPF
jgi:hypothetical protein